MGEFFQKHKFGNAAQLFLFSAICLLCGCYSDPTLTKQDNFFMQRLRYYAPSDEKKNILYYLIRENPVRLAEEAAKKEDYRLVSLAMGYHATAEHAQIFGVKCTVPVETQNIMLGCVPPPPVVFKQIKRYNVTLLQQPNFPHKESCSVDPSVDAEIEKMEKEMDVGLKRDAQRAAKRIKEWQEKRK